jgi:hypothetical protein
MMLVDAPARQNASAMHTSASSRSNSGGGGLNGSSQSDVSIHERGKTCRRCSVPDLGGFSPFLCHFGSCDTQIPAQAMGMVIKIVMIQQLFKFSLSLK